MLLQASKYYYYYFNDMNSVCWALPMGTFLAGKFAGQKCRPWAAVCPWALFDPSITPPLREGKRLSETRSILQFATSFFFASFVLILAVCLRPSWPFHTTLFFCVFVHHRRATPHHLPPTLLKERPAAAVQLILLTCHQDPTPTLFSTPNFG